MFNFKETEEKILKFWDDHKIFQKSMDIRKKGKKFVFFEGPPTANGRPGIHHFVGRAYKDLFNRYKTMRGFYVLRKAGWDTHGLPVELEVEKQLGFKNKKDIEAYGIAPFNRKARESVWTYKKEWEDLTRRMGFWVDLDHPYITYETPYMESLWAILKKIWDKSLLYLAHKVVPFCTRCGTPLSSHEVAQGYQTVKDRSVYIKFKVKDGNDKVKKGDYILAWTTTPWTLPGNVALAVGKDIEYINKKVGTEYYIVAKERAVSILMGEEYVTEVKPEESVIRGAELVGLEYEPLFDIPKLKSEKSYKVYAADFVTTTDGTGIVHTAVMYGEDDYNLGTQLGLPKVHTVDEQGRFVGVGTDFDGLNVKHKDKPTEEKTTQKIIDYLKEKNLLFKEEVYEHEYPFCWRCQTPLLYYAKTSWFIKMSVVREQMIKNNQTVNWVPENVKDGRFGQWLKDGKDWAISRERYWGTPLPIWRCTSPAQVDGTECGAIRMLGSVKEVEDYAIGSGNTYFIMRHGASERNEATDYIIGSRLTDDKYHLVDKGHEQVSKSLAKLKLKMDHFDVIYASPFLRTKETSEAAGKVFHHKVILDERLGEIRHDQACEGHEHTKCPDLPKRANFDDKEDHGSGTGESYNDVRRRLNDFMKEIEAQHKNKKVLIVSHGLPLIMLELIAEGATEAQVREGLNVTMPKLAEARELKWRTIPRSELGELDLHRPFVDEIAVKCEKCGAQMKRILDLIDVWFDSGAMPYAQWHWPFDYAEGKPSEKILKEQFPAGFIAEGVDQTRGWFYTLLAISTLLDKGAPYQNVISLGHVLDDKGQKMSKSKGNVIAPGQVMDEFGVDTARWYFYTINGPGDSKNFSMKEVKERMTGFMATLQNCVKFYELYEKTEDKVEKLTKNSLDDWMLSRLHGLIGTVTERMESYDSMGASRTIERFVVDDLSNWWLRRSRKRPEAYGLLRLILIEVSKLLAPFVPYTAEDIYHRLAVGKGDASYNEGESVHLLDWPKVDKKKINLKLEEEMSRVQAVVTVGLAQRKEKQIKVRQPLGLVTIAGKKFDLDLEEVIKAELNVKNIEYIEKGDLSLSTDLTPELKAEGFAREFMRQIQDMRKEAGYRVDDRIYCQWFSEDVELSAAIFHWAEGIKSDTVLSDLMKNKHDEKVYDVEKEFDLVTGKKIWIGIRK